MANLLQRFVKSPTSYLKRAPLYVSGVYFDIFVRRYNACGCSFRLPKGHTSKYERGHAYVHGYETAECLLAREFIPPGSTVLELGACIGVVSCLLNKRLSHPRRHVAVEANPFIIPYLEENRHANRCEFLIENCIISDRSKVRFYVNQSMVLSGSQNPSGQMIECVGTRIEELERKHDLRFDFLVMDIEGAEYEVITNNLRYLKERIRGIILEKHPDVVGQEKIQEYEGLLRDNGFEKIKTLGHVDFFRQGQA
jgi:FkbM family methyltransferase